MKTRNIELLSSLMKIRQQINNVILHQSPDFNYDMAIELIEISIEIAKMNVLAEVKR